LYIFFIKQTTTKRNKKEGGLNQKEGHRWARTYCTRTLLCSTMCVATMAKGPSTD